MIDLLEAMDKGMWLWTVCKDRKTEGSSLLTGIIVQVYARNEKGRRLALFKNPNTGTEVPVFAEDLFSSHQDAAMSLLEIPSMALEERAVITLMKEHGVKCYYVKDFGIWMEDRIVEQVPLQPINKLRNLEDMKAKASCPKDTGAE